MGDILFLAHRVPFPPDRGDKIRAYNVLKHLAARKRVHLVAFADTPLDMATHGELIAMTASREIIWRGKSRLRSVVEGVATGRPASVAAFFDPGVAHSVERMLMRHVIDEIYVFSSQMAQFVPDRLKPRQRVIMDFVDVDSAKFADYADTATAPMRWLYAREARTLLAHDRAVAARFDANVFVSDAEAALFREQTGVDRIYTVENGIDTVSFSPTAMFDRVTMAGPTIVFTGQMDYPPNIEAARWLVEDILPIVRQSSPDVCVAIVGRNPSAPVSALAKMPGVTVTGEVPDVRGWLAGADVVVAPLKLARGVQNKVLEAMAMARPVVASGPAAEGIDHEGTIRVGKDADGIAAAIGELLNDRVVAARLGGAARARVIERYGWDARLAVLDQIMGLNAPAGSQVAA